MNDIVIIPLFEPVNVLKAEIKNYFNTPVNDYVYVAFITKLLEDIFDGYNANSVSELAPSTHILLNLGIDLTSAIRLSSKIFNLVVSVISTYIEDVTFNTRTYSFQLYGEYDLKVSRIK